MGYWAEHRDEIAKRWYDWQAMYGEPGDTAGGRSPARLFEMI
jgi:hypothetical protein